MCLTKAYKLKIIVEMTILLIDVGQIYIICLIHRSLTTLKIVQISNCIIIFNFMIIFSRKESYYWVLLAMYK